MNFILLDNRSCKPFSTFISNLFSIFVFDFNMSSFDPENMMRNIDVYIHVSIHRLKCTPLFRAIQCTPLTPRI
jgi:hypothetical protein